MTASAYHNLKNMMMTEAAEPKAQKAHLKEIEKQTVAFIRLIGGKKVVVNNSDDTSDIVTPAQDCKSFHAETVKRLI